MSTGLILGAAGATIWFSTLTAESRSKIEATTATALFSVSLMLMIAATLFVIGSVGPIA